MTAQAPARVIPVSEPSLTGREADYVLDCMTSGWISSEGPYVERFERAWAEYCGAKHGIAVSSGTAALYAAVDALRLQPGDEIILPSFTIISCAQAITAAGATPVLVDVEPDTWCIDAAQVAARITPRTRAIMAVHMYGHPADMNALRALAAAHDLKLIEDAAQAHGAEYRGRRAGSLGDIACFSFYANKIITTGEGGMVLTDDDTVASCVRSYRNLAFQPDRRFFHTELGQNFRMTALQAAVGLAQTERIDALVARKRAIGRRYTELLAGIDGIALPVERRDAKNVYWMYGLVIDEALGFDAAELAHRLLRRGIATRPFFLGMHEQPALRDLGLFAGERYPVSERIARQGLYLPSGMALTDSDLESVALAVHEEVGA